MNKFGAGLIASAMVLFAASALAVNIATIEGYSSGTAVTLDSSPVVTAIASQGGGYTVNGYTYNSWLIFVQDSTGSIALYGPLPGSYIPAVGDAVSVAGTYSPYHQIPEIGSITSLTQVSTGNVVPTPPVFTIPQLTASTTLPENQAGYVLQLSNVTIYTDSAATMPASGNFPNSNTAFYVKDSSGNIMTMYFWVTFESVDGAMIGTRIPTGPVNITGNVEVYPGLPVEINPHSFTAVPVPPPAPLLGTRTLRIVTYNIDADQDQWGPQYALPQPGLISPDNSTIPYTTSNLISGGALEGIGEEIINGDPAQPIDILTLEETTSNTNTVQAILDGLNAFYAYYGIPAGYAMSPYQALSTRPATGGGPSAMVYNTNTLQLLASVPVDPPGGPSQLGADGEAREVVRYEFAPAGVTPGTNNEFHVYVAHSDASDDPSAHNGEATIIRNNESTNCPANARVLYVGDFNLYDSWDAGYLTMLSNTAPDGVSQGQAIDPLNVSGATNIDWGDPTTNPAIIFMIDESADHLVYRCELQYMTSNVFYDVGGGLQYVPGSHHCFGNNASLPYGSSVTAIGNTALNDLDPVLTNQFKLPATTLYIDLTNTTDHLPVVADYIIPVPLTVPVANFTANPTYGLAPLTVNFVDTSTGPPSSWTWADTNGDNSTNKNASFSYATPGTYTVQLIACSAGGCSTNTQTIIVITPFLGWQNEYFSPTGSLNPQAGPSVDRYGTGMSNTNKFLAGFAGNVPSAYLHIISVATANGTNVVVTYLGASGDTNYVPGVQSRTNVLDFTTGDPGGNYTNGAWQDTGQTNILGVRISAAGGEGTGLGTVTNMTDFGGATNDPSRYYRVRVLLP
jgi:PKD repeat protein